MIKAYWFFNYRVRLTVYFPSRDMFYVFLAGMYRMRSNWCLMIGAAGFGVSIEYFTQPVGKL